MRRNKTVIKAILQGVGSAVNGNQNEVRQYVADATGAGTEEQDFHFALLEQAGFLFTGRKTDYERKVSSPTYTLTWQGHDLLEELELNPLY